MIKIVIFDIDGTLRSKKDKRILESTKKAIIKLKEKGIKVGIATGRHLIEIKKENLLEDLTFDFYITLNGGLCYIDNKIIYKNNIHKDIKNHICKISIENNIPLFVLEENDIYANMINDYVIESHKAIHAILPKVKDISHNDIYQFCVYCNSDDIKLFKDVSITKWHDYAYDIIPLNQSKLVGINKILDYYHLTLDQCMSFGDDKNNIEMLKNSKIGIAMGDGHSIVKNIADFTTKNSDEDGIYYALVQYGILMET